MILGVALAAAVLFGASAYLLLQRGLLRTVAGIALISQAATLTLIGASLSRGQAPIAPKSGQPVSDPVPQALVLTALVIGLATIALLLALVGRVVAVYRTTQREQLAALETEHEEGLEPDERQDRSEAE